MNQCSGGSASPSGHGHDHSGGEEGGKVHFETEWAMGLSLVLGFAVMFLIDQFGPSHHRRSSTPLDPEPAGKSFKSAFFGLLVHAAADGIALGAASMGENSNLEMVVFFAIMLHKAPGSFGLATYLLHEGLTRNVCWAPPSFCFLSVVVMFSIFPSGVGQKSDCENVPCHLLLRGSHFVTTELCHPPRGSS